MTTPRISIFFILVSGVTWRNFPLRLDPLDHPYLCTPKTGHPIPSKLNELWSSWQFSFWLWTKYNSVWFIDEIKTVTTIIFHQIWKERKIYVSECWSCNGSQQNGWRFKAPLNPSASTYLPWRLRDLRDPLMWPHDDWKQQPLGNL